MDAPGTLDRLRAALEASWNARTAYQGAVRPGNPAFGQCYPTARVVQHFFPAFEIACGDVDTGAGVLPLVLDDRHHLLVWIRLYSRCLAARTVTP